MALTKTIAEIKEVLPKVVANQNSASLLPNFDAAEQTYLVPLIGNELYTLLQTKYTAEDLTPKQTALLKHIRLFTAAYAYHDEAIASHVVVTDDGLRTMSTDNMPKAVGWEYKEHKAFLLDRALYGAENMLAYLWANKADFAEWTGSTAYKQFASLLIRTGTEFSEQYKLYQPMRTFYALRGHAEDVQNDYIVSGIGSKLVTYLVEKEAPSADEAVIIKALKKAMAFFSIRRACDHLSVRFSDSGFTIINEIMGGDRESEDAGRSAASDQRIKDMKKVCDREGKNFMLSAKRLLVKHRASGTSTAEFNEAYDEGPLFEYKDPSEKTSGNETRKIFRF